MARKHDLEENIRESYKIIQQYEQIERQTERPEERLRASRMIREQRALIEKYLNEYKKLVKGVLPQDIQEIDQDPPQKGQDVLVVGSGNAEIVLDLDEDLIIGRKHNVKRVELLGGSGVNYTFRLSKYDETRVLPILSIGQDEIGRGIREAIVTEMQSKRAWPGISRFFEEENLLCPDLRTPQTTVVTSGEQQRTIFREEIRGAEHFRGFFEKRLAEVKGLDGVHAGIGAVMIGHIPADRRDDICPGYEGWITRELINHYRDQAIVFTNFGESQFSSGHEFWEETLREGVTVFQLSIEEAREFFGHPRGGSSKGAKAGQPRSLLEMIGWFQKRGITAVITLDRFGAVATFQGGKGVLFAPAFDLENFKDSTGAGDAFGAGLVHALCRAGKPISFLSFQAAIEDARMWAAHACTTRGAASECPVSEELQRFKKDLESKSQDLLDFIPCRTLSEWESIFRILDKAY